MYRHAFHFLVSAFVSVLASAASTAQGTVTWTGGGGTRSWDEPRNWQPNRVPTARDTVVIPGNSGNIDIPAGKIDVGGLTLEDSVGGGGTTLSNNSGVHPNGIQDIKVNAGAGGVTVGSGNTVRGANSTSANPRGGDIDITAQGDVVNRGTIAGGTSGGSGATAGGSTTVTAQSVDNAGTIAGGNGSNGGKGGDASVDAADQCTNHATGRVVGGANAADPRGVKGAGGATNVTAKRITNAGTISGGASVTGAGGNATVTGRKDNQGSATIRHQGSISGGAGVDAQHGGDVTVEGDRGTTIDVEPGATITGRKIKVTVPTGRIELRGIGAAPRAAPIRATDSAQVGGKATTVDLGANAATTRVIESPNNSLPKGTSVVTDSGVTADDLIDADPKFYAWAPAGDYDHADAYSSLPVPAASGPSRCQAIYDASLLSDLTTGALTGLAFRRTNFSRLATDDHRFSIDVWLGSAGVPAAAAASTLSYAANRGLDRVRVIRARQVRWPATNPPLDGFAGAPVSLWLPFDVPFSYAAGNNLVVEVDSTTLSGTDENYAWNVDAEGWCFQGCNGGVVVRGDGCPSTSTLTATSVPAGSGLWIRWANDSFAPVGRPAVGLIGFSSRFAWGSVRLPLSLASLGASGCWLHVDPMVSRPGSVVGTTGRVDQAVPVGLDATLAGLDTFVQTLVVDPGFNAFGMRASPMAQVRLGPAATSVEPGLTLHSIGTGRISDVPQTWVTAVPLLAIQQ